MAPSKAHTTHHQLPVMEHFYTIQGEGYHQGRAAYFVRLGGCDVGCTWCDVKESWDAVPHPKMNIAQIVAAVRESPAEICVVTGGEPLMYDLDSLTNALHEAGLKTHLETSAAHPFSGSWDWVCVSPKRFKKALPENLPLANELKVVIAHRNDLRFAEQYAATVSPQCKLFLQPEWEQRETAMPLIAEYAKQHPRWMISLQLHKYLRVP